MDSAAPALVAATFGWLVTKGGSSTPCGLSDLWRIDLGTGLWDHATLPVLPALNQTTVSKHGPRRTVAPAAGGAWASTFHLMPPSGLREVRHSREELLEAREVGRVPAGPKPTAVASVPTFCSVDDNRASVRCFVSRPKSWRIVSPWPLSKECTLQLAGQN